MKLLHLLSFLTLAFSCGNLSAQDVAEATGLEETQALPQDLGDSLSQRGFMHRLLCRPAQYPCVYEQIDQTFWRSSYDLNKSTLKTVLPKKRYIRLLSGSVWQVDPSDESKIDTWNSRDIVSLTYYYKLSWFRGFSCSLYNHNRSESVQVKVACFSHPDAEESFMDRITESSGWISSAVFGTKITLEKGTSWWLCSRDESLMARWEVGDVIVIALNSTSFAERLIQTQADARYNAENYPNLLINLSKGHSCAAYWHVE